MANHPSTCSSYRASARGMAPPQLNFLFYVFGCPRELSNYDEKKNFFNPAE
jgi:hypothetical protein